MPSTVDVDGHKQKRMDSPLSSISATAQSDINVDVDSCPSQASTTDDMHPTRIIIVGNGMVGYAFCDQLTKLTSESQHQITVFGEERYPAYDRVHLTDFLANESPDDLLLADRNWYKDRHIDLQTDTRIASIDRDAKEVVTNNGVRHPYDRLVLATGSYPFIPPIDGSQDSNIAVYRTIDDLKNIAQKAKTKHAAAVIGGGLLGIEAAAALMKLGLRVHLIEVAAQLMPRQLDGPSSEVLREKLLADGLHVRIDTATRRIQPVDEHFLLSLNDDEQLAVDMVIIAAGIRPRDELAREAELDIASRGGVIVNDQLQSVSDPNIYAIGECASHRGIVYGLVGPGYEMARTLAQQWTTLPDAVFEDADRSTRLKLMGHTVANFGRDDVEGNVRTWVGKGAYRSFTLQGDRIVAAKIVGDWDELSQVQYAIEQTQRLTNRQLKRFENNGDIFGTTKLTSVLDWPEQRLVCNCLKVTKGELSLAVTQGACTIAELGKCTGAGTVCGSCQPLLAQLTGDLHAAQPVAGRKTMTTFSILAMIACAVILVLTQKPLHFSDNFESVWYQIDQVWRIGIIRQITGFGLLGIAVLGMILSLRKRIKFLSKLGNYGWYRTFHTAMGLLCIFGLIVHTGMRMGDNLNMLLMLCFVGLNILGAVAGVATALESRMEGRVGDFARRWRPWLTWAHLLLFWPLPVLVGFHIVSVYYF
ncbi:MAG TPA: nitrite reductase [Phycisphaerales bacterium]|nr:nitrite reductase [Phycisphaerales bacterium]